MEINRIGGNRELEATHHALWASGDYPAVAAELIPELGPELVRACGIRTGDRVLDVAAGSGNAAIPAARTGATVTASDLTPELFAAGRWIAEARGVEVEWVEADAEAMPFADNGFDVVMSCVGAMFAPDHQATADELIRLCRPGGTIGMINWTPDGFIGSMFATIRALRAAATSRRRSATAVGRREPCAQPVRRPGHLAEHASSDRADRPLPEPK